MMNVQNNIRNAPLLSSFLFTLTNINNPWKLIHLWFNKPVKVRVKLGTGEEILLKNKHDFWKLRNMVLDGWKLVDAQDGLIHLARNGVTVAVTLSTMDVLREPLESVYKVFDYADKTVLDVGGYIGYTAVLFAKWGARKILIYEPQLPNIRIIKRNLELNNVNGEVHNLAVSSKNGTILLPYTSLGSIDFGLRGSNKYTVHSISASRVLSLHNVDIAKFDCEGCEYSLLSVPCSVLRRVTRYIIEYHRGFDSLREKFEECGFRVSRIWSFNRNIGVFKAVIE